MQFATTPRNALSMAPWWCPMSTAQRRLQPAVIEAWAGAIGAPSDPHPCPHRYRSSPTAMQAAVSAALGVGPPMRQLRGGRYGAASTAKAVRIGPCARGQLGAQQPPLGLQQWSTSSRAAGASLQCSASYAAAAPVPPPPAAEQPEQPQRQPLLPSWAARLVRLAATAMAVAAWYQLAGVLGGPFASVGMAAPTANEGASTWDARAACAVHAPCGGAMIVHAWAWHALLKRCCCLQPHARSQCGWHSVSAPLCTCRSRSPSSCVCNLCRPAHRRAQRVDGPGGWLPAHPGGRRPPGSPHAADHWTQVLGACGPWGRSPMHA